MFTHEACDEHVPPIFDAPKLKRMKVPIKKLHQPDIYLHAGFVSKASYFTTRNYTLFIVAKTRQYHKIVGLVQVAGCRTYLSARLP